MLSHRLGLCGLCRPTLGDRLSRFESSSPGGVSVHLVHVRMFCSVHYAGLAHLLWTVFIDISYLWCCYKLQFFSHFNFHLSIHIIQKYKNLFTCQLCVLQLCWTHLLFLVVFGGRFLRIFHMVSHVLYKQRDFSFFFFNWYTFYFFFFLQGLGLFVFCWKDVKSLPYSQS